MSQITIKYDYYDWYIRQRVHKARFFFSPIQYVHAAEDLDRNLNYGTELEEKERKK